MKLRRWRYARPVIVRGQQCTRGTQSQVVKSCRDDGAADRAKDDHAGALARDCQKLRYT
jgi:hypothetical protein